ncbi:MAG: hypothetical protein GF416_03805 [Candidatus Altiarchaeales archaeon]|nr:hypothetical protein [Candidatus Altiarchaeales archaeon]MBD3416244.1 hypothetical protein [Candidatus Altiarchaeales archaeon]
MLGYVRRILGFYRAGDWTHLLGLGLFGLAYTGKIFDIVPLFSCTIISSLYLAFGYSSNLVFERFIRKKIPFLPLFSVFLPILAALSLSFIISKGLFLVLVIGTIFSILYSGPPLYMKTVPIVELSLNSSLFTVLFLVGIFTGGGAIDYGVVGMSSLIFFLIVPFQLVQELKDLEYDEKNGFKTTANSLPLNLLKMIVFSSFFLTLVIATILPFVSKITWVFTAVTYLLCFALMHYVPPITRDQIQNRKLRSIYRIIAIFYGMIVLYIL